MLCRICKSRLIQIINLGKLSLVGEFYKKKTKSKKFKINLCFCSKCKHVQIRERINPDLLFKEYLWETGISKSNIIIINQLIKKLRNNNITKKSKVLEIACNDGAFLVALQKKLKCIAVGIDPAKNLAIKNKSKNIIRIVDFFNNLTAKKIRKKYGKFNFIIARNVLAHVKNPNEIFFGVSQILEKNGIFIVEFPSLLNIIKFNQYDNIFHEHIGFHSLRSVSDLCKINNLKLFDYEKINSQGGSLRCFITKKSSNKKISKKIKNFLNIESRNGLYKKNVLLNFKDRVNKHRESLYNLIKELKKNKKKIAAYGASGKGQALLQYSKINKFIDLIFDKSNLKNNKFTSGTNILIKKPINIKRKNIDFLLILSWNLIDEITKQEKNFLIDGGKFILPFPYPKIINK